LRSVAPGVAYRFSKNMHDKDENNIVEWGTVLDGIDENDGWARVGDRYLPMKFRGVNVLVKYRVPLGSLGEDEVVEAGSAAYVCVSGLSAGEGEVFTEIGNLDEGATSFMAADIGSKTALNAYLDAGVTLGDQTDQLDGWPKPAFKRRKRLKRVKKLNFAKIFQQDNESQTMRRNCYVGDSKKQQDRLSNSYGSATDVVKCRVSNHVLNASGSGRRRADRICARQHVIEPKSHADSGSYLCPDGHVCKKSNVLSTPGSDLLCGKCLATILDGEDYFECKHCDWWVHCACGAF